MKTTNMKRIMACLLAALTVTAVSSTTAFAASTTQNSSGSTVADAGNTAENMDGKDTTQDKKTVYSGEITADSTEEVQVYATQASTFSVKIPKVIILDGQAGTAKYQVSVKGNINGEEMVSVVPTESFKMSQSGKADITATTTQTVQNFVNTTIAERVLTCVALIQPVSGQHWYSLLAEKSFPWMALMESSIHGKFCRQQKLKNCRSRTI